MREQTASSHIRIPELHPPTEIGLTLLLRLVKRRGGSCSVGIHMDPALLPERFHDEIFFTGICNAAHAAIAETYGEKFDGNIEIEVNDLAISRGLDDLTQKEIEFLREKLERLTKELVLKILGSMLQNRRP